MTVSRTYTDHHGTRLAVVSGESVDDAATVAQEALDAPVRHVETVALGDVTEHRFRAISGPVTTAVTPVAPTRGAFNRGACEGHPVEPSRHHQHAGCDYPNCTSAASPFYHVRSVFDGRYACLNVCDACFDRWRSKHPTTADHITLIDPAMRTDETAPLPPVELRQAQPMVEPGSTRVKRGDDGRLRFVRATPVVTDHDDDDDSNAVTGSWTASDDAELERWRQEHWSFGAVMAGLRDGMTGSR